MDAYCCYRLRGRMMNELHSALAWRCLMGAELHVCYVVDRSSRHHYNLIQKKVITRLRFSVFYHIQFSAYYTIDIHYLLIIKFVSSA